MARMLRPPPDGYEPLPRTPVAGFGLAPPPGFVSMKGNRPKLIRDWGADSAAMYALQERISEGDVWLEPRTLQLLQMEKKSLPGICARNRVILEHERSGRSSRVDDVTLGGQPWSRTTSKLGEVVMIRYDHCVDDVLWTVSTGLSPTTPVAIAQRRFDGWLTGARLE
ncbi:hypothetical protein L6R52_12445 [Myxococcota bacterium]|nr:hypothetical protein [Myxococcota bacterium]